MEWHRRNVMMQSHGTSTEVQAGPAACGNSDPLFDAAKAAEYLGLAGVVKHPGQAVRALARKRRLRSTRIAGKVMIRRSWLETYIREGQVEACEASG